MKEIDFIAELSFLRSDEGGRIGPAHSGYRPHIKFNDYPEYRTSGAQIYQENVIAYPGEKLLAEIAIIGIGYFTHKLEEGMTFEFYEGNRKIGSGVIIEILNQKLTKQHLMKIELLKGDITGIEIEAIVNAANSSLLGGGGVDGAIHRKGGPEILNECMKIRNRQGGCKVGEAVITTGGKLPARYVIHTVGPVWNEGKGVVDELLASCYENSLKLAEANEIKSIAFPNISTGIYRFPKPRAARIAIEAVKKYLENSDKIENVVFVCYDAENHQLYEDLLLK